MRVGADLETEAKALFDLLDENEGLGPLDGDTPFWVDIGEIGARYNGRPCVHGAVERLGI